MKLYLKCAFFGILVWLIPFLLSGLFYGKDGLMIDIFLFKTIMIVIGAVSGSILLIFYFKKIESAFVKEAAIAGTAWFAINILLDIVILLPLSGMGISDYFTQIGLRYLVMPAMSLAIGVSLKLKA